MVQSNRAARLVIKSQVATCLIRAVNASHVDQNVNKFRTNFVIFDLYGVLVSSDVNFADYVEQESFLDLARAHELV